MSRLQLQIRESKYFQLGSGSLLFRPIRASFQFLTDSGSGGHLTVNATTSLSPLNLTFVGAPVDSTLVLYGATALSNAFLRLHETFEGIFRLASTFTSPTVKYDQGAEHRDPAKRGRERIVEYNVNNRILDGKAVWGKDTDAGKRGRVDLFSSIGKVELSL